MEESLAMNITIVIPDMNGVELTLKDVYPTYCRANCFDDDPQANYEFYFKEGGSVVCDKEFGLYTLQHLVNGEWIESEKFLFLPGEEFVPQSGISYCAWGYSDGHISAEYEDENPPVVHLSFSIITEERYKLYSTEDHLTGGTLYPISKLVK